MSAMTFQSDITSEFDEVRQHHDAMMERSRLALMAEQIRNNGDQGDSGELLTSIERHMRELDQVLGPLKS